MHGELGFPHVDEVKDVSYAAAVGRQEEQSVVERALLAVKTIRSPLFKSGEMASVNGIEKQPRKPRMMGPFECLLDSGSSHHFCSDESWREAPKRDVYGLLISHEGNLYGHTHRGKIVLRRLEDGVQLELLDVWQNDFFERVVPSSTEFCR